MLDFDKMFEEYAMSWYEKHESEFETPEEMESQMPSVYDEWADAPAQALGGIAPREFFSNITDPDQLVDILIGTSEGESNPCSLLLDRIAEMPETADGLIRIVEGNKNPKLTMLAMNLIGDLGAPQPYDTYIAWLTFDDVNEEQKELAVEIMSRDADAVAEKLYAIAEGAGEDVLTLIAEILVNAKKDERTYKILTELFTSGNNIPLYAGYLGKYGDERASGMLYRALDDCNYLEYLEIKNAIERMGGTVDDVRDFSEDMYYKAIKNIK